MNKKLYAVDLDGTLAHYDEFRGDEHIGEPILPMLERVKKWLEEGHEVIIFTARASHKNAIIYVEKWCQEHIGQILPVTNEKTYDIDIIYDDRAIQIEKNTGMKMTKIAYDRGFQDGHQKGYDEGKENGYNEGWDHAIQDDI